MRDPNLLLPLLVGNMVLLTTALPRDGTYQLRNKEANLCLDDLPKPTLQKCDTTKVSQRFTIKETGKIPRVGMLIRSSSKKFLKQESLAVEWRDSGTVWETFTSNFVLDCVTIRPSWKMERLSYCEGHIVCLDEVENLSDDVTEKQEWCLKEL